MMDPYEELGLVPVINAYGSGTLYGGSLMSDEVMDAMRAAAGQFCPLDEVHARVGERIADRLQVEGAYVTSGAACGLVLTTAACIAGADPDKIAQLPDTTGMKRDIIMQAAHRIPYDQAVRIPGARLVEIPAEAADQAAAIGAAISAQTAALFYCAHAMAYPGSLSFQRIVDMAHAAGVPVIVDAASECPPVSTLTRFARGGADLVIFSGGKSIMGPQSTGLVVGRSDLIAACAANGTPNAAIGRPMKVSREEIFGFLKALERYLERDHAADAARWEAQVAYLAEALVPVTGFATERFVIRETYDVPVLLIKPMDAAGPSRDQLIGALREGRPRVAVAEQFTTDNIIVNPHMLQPGQERIVAERLREVLATA